MIEPDRQIWDGVLAHLKAHHPTLCRQWFHELEPVGIAGGVFRVRSLTPLHRDYLQRACVEGFNDAIQSVSGRLLTVRFLGPGEHADPSPPPPVAVNGDARPPRRHGVINPRREDGLVINPDYAFEHFVIGPENRLAHAAAIAVAANPGHAYNPLFIHGGVGLGKTHLLQAICLRVIEANPDAVMYYLSCEGFMSQFFEGVQAGEMSEFRHKFRDVDVLVIDDIHFLAKRDVTQEEFFHTFNSLYQSNKQIVLSSDAAPEDIPALEERLVSRFKWGLVAEMGPPGYETRAAIIKKKAALRGLAIPDDVAGHVALIIDTNIRELEGALTKLQIQSSVEGRPIDLSMTRSALGDVGPTSSGSTMSVQTILEAVTDFYGIRLADLQSRRRQRSIALPRQVCMYLARRHTRHSLEEIGAYIGARDHTTVMHALKTVELRRASDTDFNRLVTTLEERLVQQKR